jgi:DUF1680 family protein
VSRNTSEAPTSTRYSEPNIHDVRVEGDFWAARIQPVLSTTLPGQYEMLASTGRLAALQGWDPEIQPEPHVFWDSDIAKWIEAASYSLAIRDDPKLDSRIDEVIALLAQVQQEDGYLNSYFTYVRPGKRWTDLRDAHELYCAGHLIEAGVAHAEVTGKTTLLEVVRRYADHIATEFGTGPGQLRGYPGHEEIELALVKLSRFTGDPKYRELSRYFIDERGTEPHYFTLETQSRGDEGYFGFFFPDRVENPFRYREYNQSHAPVRNQDKVVGHAVRAMYLYSAMADLADELGDASLLVACEKLWRNLTERQLYITGGLGQSHEIEGFTAEYDLPSATAYAETCAAIGLVFWSSRMARVTGKASYVDVMERALYNAVLGGMSLDGCTYFYGNPLASDGTVSRQEWFDVACCPPNVARLLTSLGKYVYAVGASELLVQLYVSGRVKFHSESGEVQVQQVSDAPWGGNSRFLIDAGAPVEFTIRLRVPSWSRGAEVAVNGERLLEEVDGDGYISVARTWSRGDDLQISFVFGPERVYANPKIVTLRNRVSIARGPLVYCWEQADQESPLKDVALRVDSVLHVAGHDGLDVLAVSTEGLALSDEWGSELYRNAPPETLTVPILAVPYFAWNNRGRGGMEVWIPEIAPQSAPATSDETIVKQERNT